MRHPPRNVGWTAWRAVAERVRLVGGVWCLLVVAVLAGCAPGPAPLAEARPGGGADGLVGATPASLRARFGPPGLLRRDGPAEVWVYRSSVCAVDLILYPDPRTGVPTVAVADVRALGTPGSAAACLAGLTGARNPPAGRVTASGL
ncbi:MAG: hypothetical protein M0002_04335 [Rhodospirillales bacterium]|nr:hypothetical protein [Rhodospirillales bacterium]